MSSWKQKWSNNYAFNIIDDLEGDKMQECINTWGIITLFSFVIINLLAQPQKQAEIFIYTKKKKFLDQIAAYMNSLPQDSNDEVMREKIQDFK